MVLAIEPMVNVGHPGVRVLDDGWTAVTRDGWLSAHFEHTVAVTANGPAVLSRRPDETVADVDDDAARRYSLSGELPPTVDNGRGISTDQERHRADRWPR